MNQILDPAILDGYEDDGNEAIELDKAMLIRKSANQVVVYTTDWTAETVVAQVAKGNINLNPSFQRRDAWLDDRKSRFIESLFLGLPVPQIVLAESKTEKGKFIVIDGKQRLLTIMQFSSKSNDGFKNLKLRGLEILPELNGFTRSDIEQPKIVNFSQFADISAFDNQGIRTVIIKNWSDDLILYEIFLRLNQGSVPLSPQELRQALLPGPFTTFIDIYSAESPTIRKILGIDKPDRRMRDAELLIRYIAFRNFLPDYKGDLKDFFDVTCNIMNDSWATNQALLERQISDFDNAYQTALAIFGDKNVFKKWNGASFEKRINRALFDVMSYYFSNEEISRLSLSRRDAILQNFKDLCTSDFEFRTSIETSTKNLLPTQYRFDKFAELLSKSLEIKIDSPQIKSVVGVK